MRKTLIHLQSATTTLRKLWPPKQQFASLGEDAPTYSASLRTVRRMFTPRRLELIQRLTALGAPIPVADLARALDRHNRSVHYDLTLLAKHGIVDLQPGAVADKRRGPRGTLASFRVSDLAMRFAALEMERPPRTNPDMPFPAC